MKKNFLAMLLMLVLCAVLTTGAAETACSHHAHTAACGGLKNNCTYACAACAEEIQALVDVLPEYTAIGEQNRAQVEAQLTRIDQRKATVSDATCALVDFTKYANAAFVLQLPQDFFGFCALKRYEEGVDGPQARLVFEDETGAAATLYTIDGTSATAAQPESNGAGELYMLPAGTYTVKEIVDGDWNMTLTVDGAPQEGAVFTGEAGGVYMLTAMNETPSYNVDIDMTGEGSVIVESRGTKNDGTVKEYSFVTLTVQPKDGWVLKTLSACDADENEVTLTKIENENIEYGFTMPSSAVTVEVTFAETGKLRVTNKVESSREADKDAEFEFTVTLDEEISGTYGDMTFDEGVAVFKLKADQSATAKGLPAGTGYTVEAAAKAGFELEAEEAQEGTIDANSGCVETFWYYEVNTVSFMNGDELWSGPIPCRVGTTLGIAGMPAPVPEDGYVFGGWYTKDGVSVEHGMSVKEDMVAYATWQKLGESTVTVYAGDTATLSVEADAGSHYSWAVNYNDGTGWHPCGSDSSTYTTTPVKLENNGYRYRCYAIREGRGTPASHIFTLEVLAKTELPQTGDDSSLGLWLALVGVSLTGMTLILLQRRRKEN